MSRVSILEQLKVQRKSALEFHYEELTAPPILALFTPQDINELYSIATSVRYNGNINRKYELIDAVMKRRGFRRAHCGTNRVVYNFLNSEDFVAKVAVDKVGMTDSPAEYRNQQYFAPFCCKIFEVDPTGVIAFVERVNPISSLEEFISIADDIFNLMITKIIGKYVVDDLGSKTYMNFGIRQNSHGYTFGPVIIDFPYVYEVDGAKLICRREIKTPCGIQLCGGELDYDAGFNHIYCTKCGKEYKAMDLAKDKSLVSFHYTDNCKADIRKMRYQMRARVVDNGKVILDSGHKSKTYLNREEFLLMNSVNIPVGEMQVSETIKTKRQHIRKLRDNYYSALQKQYYEDLNKREPFNPVIESVKVEDEVKVGKTIKGKSEDSSSTSIAKLTNLYSDYSASEETIPVGAEVITTTDKYGRVSESLHELERTTFPETENGVYTEDDVMNINNNEDADEEDYEQPAEEAVSVVETIEDGDVSSDDETEDESEVDEEADEVEDATEKVEYAVALEDNTTEEETEDQVEAEEDTESLQEAITSAVKSMITGGVDEEEENKYKDYVPSEEEDVVFEPGDIPSNPMDKVTINTSKYNTDYIDKPKRKVKFKTAPTKITNKDASEY